MFDNFHNPGEVVYTANKEFFRCVFWSNGMGLKAMLGNVYNNLDSYLSQIDTNQISSLDDPSTLEGEIHILRQHFLTPPPVVITFLNC